MTKESGDQNAKPSEAPAKGPDAKEPSPPPPKDTHVTMARDADPRAVQKK
jgi:hypothetical protein